MRRRQATSQVQDEKPQPDRTAKRRRSRLGRAGAASVDYILLLGIVLPLAAFAVPAGKRIVELVYRMTCTLIGWPFP